MKNQLTAQPGEGPGGRPSPDAMAGRWHVQHLEGNAADLLGRPWPAPAVPSIWFLAVDRPALVLGSTQPAPPPGAVEVVRRRSGGGAVLVEPGNPLWVDVFVPSGDRHWETDVGRAFLWLGELWAAALTAAGVAGVTVNRTAPRPTALSRAVCFAGLGTGEVAVAGRKVIGISQRRTRDAALFQCAALLRWDPDGVAAGVGVAATDLAGTAAGVAVGPATLERVLLELLSEV